MFYLRDTMNCCKIWKLTATIFLIFVSCEVCGRRGSSQLKYQSLQEVQINPSSSDLEIWGSGSQLTMFGREARSIPSSSTEDLMIIFEKEKRLILAIQDLQESLGLIIKSLKRQSWKNIENNFMIFSGCRDDLDSLHEEIEDYLPSTEDHVKAAGIGLVQIQDFYKMNLTEVVNGRVADFDSVHKLRVNDCLFFAGSAESIGRLDKKIDWIEAAFDIAKREGAKDLEIKLENIIDDVKDVHDNHLLNHGFMQFAPSDIGGAVVITKQRPFNKMLEENPKYRKHLEELRSSNITSSFMFRNNPQSSGELQKPPQFFQKMRYHNRQLVPTYCSGTSLRPAAVDKDTVCIFLTHSNPYLQLGPFQLEELNSKPFIGKLYGMVSEKEAQWVMTKAKGKMKPTPLKIGKTQIKFTYKRSSKIHYIQDKEASPSKAITDRIALASRWTLNQPFAAENYQVMNYGPGGNIVYHTDQPDPETEDDELSSWTQGGPRLATTMVYLKSPNYGGRTVFPQLGLSVTPTPLSLLFWHNILPTGKMDTRAHHLSCPVVHGNKWIMNKWVKWAAQWGKLPCGRNSEQHQGAFQRWR